LATNKALILAAALFACVSIASAAGNGDPVLRYSFHNFNEFYLNGDGCSWTEEANVKFGEAWGSQFLSETGLMGPWVENFSSRPLRVTQLGFLVASCAPGKFCDGMDLRIGIDIYGAKYSDCTSGWRCPDLNDPHEAYSFEGKTDQFRVIYVDVDVLIPPHDLRYFMLRAPKRGQGYAAFGFGSAVTGEHICYTNFARLDTAYPWHTFEINGGYWFGWVARGHSE
jgi:hypothetical protein